MKKTEANTDATDRKQAYEDKTDDLGIEMIELPADSGEDEKIQGDEDISWEDEKWEEDPLEQLPKRSAKEYFREKRNRLAGMSYEERIRYHHRMVFWRTAGALLAIVLIVGGYFLLRLNIPYKTYRVLNTEERSAGTNVQYAVFDNRILRYSKDGASYYEKADKNIWNETYEMQNPIQDHCGRYAAVAEQNGMQVYLFNLEGLVKKVETQYPIQSVQVSEKGTMVLLLKNEQTFSMQYLNADGTVIAEGRLPFEKNGYPMGMSLSDDGLKLAVSFLKAEGMSEVVFYNFSNVGSAELDNIVVSDTYDNSIFTTVNYVNSKTAVFIGDQKILIYKGSQRPQLKEQIVVDGQMQSVFCDDEYVGYILRSPDKEKRYRMEIYNLNGAKLVSKEFDFAYSHVRICDGQVILYNDNEWRIYNVHGKERLKACKFPQTVTDVVAISAKKYILVSPNKTEIVRLK